VAARNVEGPSVAQDPVAEAPLVVDPYLEAVEVAVTVVVSLPENRAGMCPVWHYLFIFSYTTSCSYLSSIFAEGQPAVIDTRLADSAEDRLILSFKSLALRQDAMPPRPDYGTKG